MFAKVTNIWLPVKEIEIIFSLCFKRNIINWWFSFEVRYANNFSVNTYKKEINLLYIRTSSNLMFRLFPGKHRMKRNYKDNVFIYISRKALWFCWIRNAWNKEFYLHLVSKEIAQTTVIFKVLGFFFIKLSKSWNVLSNFS